MALLVVVGLYIAFVAALVIAGRGRLAREVALLIPNLARLFRGLMSDPRVPWHAKALAGFFLGYLAMPIDLIPDVIPVAGSLDDAIIAALVLTYVLRVAGPAVISEHWHGDPRPLRHLLSVVGARLPERVLFLCTRNSARSQMAEGLLRALGGGRYEVRSAGISAGDLRPEAVEVMREIGIDISRQRSKAADRFSGQPFDLVVTTCEEAKEVCPLFPGTTRMLHWDVADPVVAPPGEERRAAFRAARDDLRARIADEIAGL